MRLDPFGNRALTYSHTSKKHDSRQADCGGQVSYTESLARIIWKGQDGTLGSAWLRILN